MLTTLLAVHVLAFGALFVLTRYDVVLVDDNHLPIDRPQGWQEQVIPAAAAADAPTRI